MLIPEVCIRQSNHLNKIASQLHEKVFTEKDFSYLESQITKYKTTWQTGENAILNELQNITCLHFKHSFIIAYVTRYLHTVSDPLIISAHFAPEEFVDILTHELIHMLFVYNLEGYKLKSLLDSEYLCEYSQLTQIHILVFAVHFFLYNEIHKDKSRFTADEQRNKNNPDYAAAWNFVKKEGCEKILKLLHEDIRQSLSKKTDKD